MAHSEKQKWNVFVKKELAHVRPWLADLGYELEDEQPHLGGERYLMQAVTTASGRKLILLGKRTSDSQRVVIKVTSDAGGIHELERERIARRILPAIRFAYRIFFSPEELAFCRRKGQVLSIQEFIEQECPFLARSIKEQFTLALEAFKAQEGAHAATYEHARDMRKILETRTAREYLTEFIRLKEDIAKLIPDDVRLLQKLSEAEILLHEDSVTIEQYCGFLTHTDFVPHNFRIRDGRIYLLDHSSLRFGNKYEGWARFLNFMTLYHPELEQALVEYVRLNRTPEESRALRLMRIYRLTEILRYYAGWLEHVSGDLRELTHARISFWTEVLVSMLDERVLDQSVIEEYKMTRDRLRTDDEKRRQRDLH